MLTPFSRRIFCLFLITCTLFLPLCSGLAASKPEAVLDPIFQVDGDFPFDSSTPLFEIFFIETKRSDAFLLRCNGQTMLVDGGSRADQPLLARFLMAENGSWELGSMLNTHEDNDHLDAQVVLLERGAVARNFLAPIAPDPKLRGYKKLLTLLENAKIPYVQVPHGSLLQLGGGKPGDGATLLHGGLTAWQEGTALFRAYCSTLNKWDTNRRSLVLHITFGERTVLLTGDLTGKGQRDLLSFENTPLEADVYKTPHHGITPTVPVFMDAVNPKLAIITNERKRTGSQSAQLEGRGIPTYYTSNGTIYMATDGKTWYLRQAPLDLSTP